MGLSPQDWHERFKLQALWTRDLSIYLLSKAGIHDAHRVLDVGCGTAALENDICSLFKSHLFGIDIKLDFLSLAIRRESYQPAREHYNQADALYLPFPDGCFNLSYCHFLLLWLPDPVGVLKEMVRVTRKNGVILALAEPDYGGRIDYPLQFNNLAVMQEAALVRQSAHTRIGRELAALFHHTGLTKVETGVLGGHWSDHFDPEGFESEWNMLKHDLDGMFSANKLNQYHKDDLNARVQGERILYVPTFFASGTVPPE